MRILTSILSIITEQLSHMTAPLSNILVIIRHKNLHTKVIVYFRYFIFHQWPFRLPFSRHAHVSVPPRAVARGHANWTIEGERLLLSSFKLLILLPLFLILILDKKTFFDDSLTHTYYNRPIWKLQIASCKLWLTDHCLIKAVLKIQISSMASSRSKKIVEAWVINFLGSPAIKT